MVTETEKKSISCSTDLCIRWVILVCAGTWHGTRNRARLVISDGTPAPCVHLMTPTPPAQFYTSYNLQE